MTRLDGNQGLMLSSFGPFASAVYLKACEANAGLVGNVTGSAYNCHTLAVQAQNAVSFVGMGGYQQTLETSRLSLLNALKCSSGEHDAGSCAAYQGSMQHANDMNYETGQAIIDSMRPYCDPDRDPNCHP